MTINSKFNQITFNNLLSKRYNNTTDGWIELPYDIQLELNVLFRTFLRTRTRLNSQMDEAIKYASFDNLKQYGIFDRLVYSTTRNKVEYIAGQDYISELNTIKNEIKKVY